MSRMGVRILNGRRRAARIKLQILSGCGIIKRMKTGCACVMQRREEECAVGDVMRLDKLLAFLGEGTRSGVRALVRAEDAPLLPCPAAEADLEAIMVHLERGEDD